MKDFPIYGNGFAVAYLLFSGELTVVRILFAALAAVSFLVIEKRTRNEK